MRELQPETVNIFLLTPVALLCGALFLLVYIVLGRQVLKVLPVTFVIPKELLSSLVHPNRFGRENILQAKGQEGAAASG